VSDTRTENYAEALLGLARAEGAEAVVADELYRVAREIDNNVELSTTLSDLALPADRRTKVVTDVLGGNLEGFAPDLTVGQVGRVIEVGDGIARVSGLPDCAVNELLEFEDGTVGLALNLDEDSIGAVVLGEVRDIEEGQTVKATGRSSRCPWATACSVGWSTRWASRSTARATARRRPGAPRRDPGARHHGPQAGARAAADRHQVDRRDDPHRSWPA
jgi:hypothetical protein